MFRPFHQQIGDLVGMRGVQDQFVDVDAVNVPGRTLLAFGEERLDGRVERTQVRSDCIRRTFW